MPNKTIYVKDEDLPLFEKMQADSESSISSRFANFLRFEESIRNHRPVIEVMPEPTTLRDQFAMAALPGIMFAVWKEWPKDWAAYPEEAYKTADAMMEARKK